MVVNIGQKNAQVFVLYIVINKSIGQMFKPFILATMGSWYHKKARIIQKHVTAQPINAMSQIQTSSITWVFQF